MRVVLDTNILVRGEPGQLIEEAEKKVAEVLASSRRGRSRTEVLSG